MMKLLPIIFLSSLATIFLTACPEKSSESPLNAETDYTLNEGEAPLASEASDSSNHLESDSPSELDSDGAAKDEELEIEE